LYCICNLVAVCKTELIPRQVLVHMAIEVGVLKATLEYLFCYSEASSDVCAFCAWLYLTSVM
jgi:hypothetical protein